MSFLNNNFISEFFTTCLYWLVGFVNEYWLAIVLLTLILRIILIPVDFKQKKSMRVMQEIAPEVEALKKRYSMDQQLFAQKQRELYKERGASPTAGCLPMIISMILLFAFYGAIRNMATNETLAFFLNITQNGVESTELPSFLWIHNFWQPDSGLAGIFPTTQELFSFIQQNATNISPEMYTFLQNQSLVQFASDGLLKINEASYNAMTSAMIAKYGLEGIANGWFGLPIIAGGSLFVQQWYQMKKNPAMQQQKMMMYLFPLISVYICAISNSAFAVYWIAANVIMFALNIVLEQYFKTKTLAKQRETVLR